MSDSASDRGFRNAIDGEIAAFEAKQREREEDRAAAEKQLEEARGKAARVRDEVIMPLLNSLRDDFAAEGHILPTWEIRPEGNIDTPSGAAVTLTLDANGAQAGRYAINAKASVAENGVFLDLSVECSQVDPSNPSANKSTELHKGSLRVMVLTFDTQWGKDKMYTIAGQKHPAFDVQRSQAWFREQLSECARKCVRAKMERTAR
jgi:hypothetical protein